jgi:hypothetical protein
MFPWATVAKAAAMGAGVAALAGPLTGLGFALRGNRERGASASHRAKFVAEAVSEGINATAFYAIIAVPAAIAVALVRRR